MLKPHIVTDRPLSIMGNPLQHSTIEKIMTVGPKPYNLTHYIVQRSA